MSPTGPGAVRPEPDAEEAAAIAAALSLLGSAAGMGSEETSESTWRFSGRWWSRPVPQRRSRPG